MKTEEQKGEMVKNLTKLRKSLPEQNIFGDHNWIPIDAQISVIKGETTPEDYLGTEYESVAEVAALEAQHWLDGEINDSELFDPEDFDDEYDVD